MEHLKSSRASIVNLVRKSLHQNNNNQQQQEDNNSSSSFIQRQNTTSSIKTFSRSTSSQKNSPKAIEDCEFEYILDNLIVVPSKYYPVHSSHWEHFCSAPPFDSYHVKVWDLSPVKLKLANKLQEEDDNRLITRSGVSWGPFPAPSIDFLVQTVAEIAQWFEDSSINMAVIADSEESNSRSALIISAFLIHWQYFNNESDALQYLNKESRIFSGESNVLSSVSQLRVLNYFAQISTGFKANTDTFKFKSMELSQSLVPVGKTGTVGAKIAVGSQNNVLFSGVLLEELRLDEVFGYHLPEIMTDVRGSVIIRVKSKTLQVLSGSVYFSLFFHTGFLDSRDASISFTKQELDIPEESVVNTFPDDFKVTLNFEVSNTKGMPWAWQSAREMIYLVNKCPCSGTKPNAYMEGFLLYENRKKVWKSKYVAIYDGKLAYFDKSQDKNPRGVIDIAGCTVARTMIEGIDKGEFGFQVQPLQSSEKFRFRATTEMQQLLWMNSIGHFATTCIMNIPLETSTNYYPDVGYPHSCHLPMIDGYILRFDFTVSKWTLVYANLTNNGCMYFTENIKTFEDKTFLDLPLSVMRTDDMEKIDKVKHQLTITRSQTKTKFFFAFPSEGDKNLWVSCLAPFCQYADLIENSHDEEEKAYDNLLSSIPNLQVDTFKALQSARKHIAGSSKSNLIAGSYGMAGFLAELVETMHEQTWELRYVKIEGTTLYISENAFKASEYLQVVDLKGGSAECLAYERYDKANCFELNLPDRKKSFVFAAESAKEWVDHICKVLSI